MTSAREEILKKLRSTVHQVPEMPDFEEPVFPPVKLPLERTFKESLESICGEVQIHTSEIELYAALKNFLKNFNQQEVFCNETFIGGKLQQFDIPFQFFSNVSQDVKVGITGCEFLIARTGSVMVSSAMAGGRQMSVYPDCHIVITEKKQLVADLEEAYKMILQKYKDNFPSHVALISGPSRTADIEKTLVLGAHGPRQLIVFLLI